MEMTQKLQLMVFRCLHETRCLPSELQSAHQCAFVYYYLVETGETVHQLEMRQTLQLMAFRCLQQTICLLLEIQSARPCAPVYYHLVESEEPSMVHWAALWCSRSQKASRC
jgi:hypothetical protein